MGVALKQNQQLTSSFCLKPITSKNCQPRSRERSVPQHRTPSNHLTSSFSFEPLGSKKNRCIKRAQSLHGTPLETRSGIPFSRLCSSFSIRPHTPALANQRIRPLRRRIKPRTNSPLHTPALANKRIRPLRRRITPRTNAPLQSSKPIESEESTTGHLISSFSVIPRALKSEQGQLQNDMQIMKKRMLSQRSSEECAAPKTFGSLIQKRKKCLTMERRIFSDDWMGALKKLSKKTPESVPPASQKKRKGKKESCSPMKKPKDQPDDNKAASKMKHTSFAIPRVHLGVRKSSRRRVKRLFDS